LDWLVGVGHSLNWALGLPTDDVLKWMNETIIDERKGRQRTNDSFYLWLYCLLSLLWGVK
jgi:hypothetical protein